MIVNATNRRLLGRYGVNGAIHDAAGPELLEACCGICGACSAGDAKVPPSFDVRISIQVSYGLLELTYDTRHEAIGNGRPTRPGRGGDQ